MTEQFEKAVEIGGLFVTAIQFLFTVTGKDQNRGAIIPDMVQGSRFVDCRLQRFQPSLVAGFEMSDYLTAERDDPGELVGIFPITRQQLLIQSDHIDQISACRMAGNIDGVGVASVFSYIIEYPSNGGSGIIGSGRVAISGGTVNAAGGDGGNGKHGGYGIISNDIDLSGSLELTAKAGRPNGKALSRAGSELELDTIKDKLGPGAKVTVTDADGKVNQVSIPRPVEPEKPVIPEESSSSSDGGSSAPSAPASSLLGLTVTDKDGQRISYTSTQSGNTLTVCVGRFTASFRISLAALRQLRAEGIETITFQTILCSTTLSVDELLAMGGEDAEVVLTHHIRSSTLTVGGRAV